MSAPKCTSWRGHRFEARYNLGAAPAMTENELLFAWSSDYPAILKEKRTKTYVHDICIRCGHVVKAPDTERAAA